MYYILLFLKGQPHNDENFISGFYTEDYNQVENYLEIVDLEICEAVLFEEIIENDN